ncbi:hypothetical protein ACIRFH_24030 [Streptomyces sp. NPDC093586]|uniref:hypothetical protein n=1 Tax=Streptomyces sp. NPDC093586 TaxID=3366042 RepID=UPI0037FEC075
MFKLKRFRTALVGIAVMAGLGVGVAPARAADTCTAGGGGKYICDYGVTDHALPGGGKEQFLVGLDYAVWTRWTVDKRWTGWVSLGKPDPLEDSARAASEIGVRDRQSQNNFQTDIYLHNSNGAFVGRTRPALGSGWTPWEFPNCC